MSAQEEPTSTESEEASSDASKEEAAPQEGNGEDASFVMD